MNINIVIHYCSTMQPTILRSLSWNNLRSSVLCSGSLDPRGDQPSNRAEWQSTADAIFSLLPPGPGFRQCLSQQGRHLGGW